MFFNCHTKREKKWCCTPISTGSSKLLIVLGKWPTWEKVNLLHMKSKALYHRVTSVEVKFYLTCILKQLREFEFFFSFLVYIFLEKGILI